MKNTKGMGKGRTIKTYGCQMNAHDTEVMAGILNALGYSATSDINEADVILIIHAPLENAENKVFSEIGNLKHLKRTPLFWWGVWLHVSKKRISRK